MNRFFLGLFWLAGSAALAAKPIADPKFPEGYRVDFSEFSYRTPLPSPAPPSERPLAFIGASSWSPPPFSLENRVHRVSNFGSTLPTFTLGAISPALTRSRAGSLHARIAIDFTRLERPGGLDDGTATSSQHLYLFPLELGLRFRPEALRAGSAQGFVSASLVPTVGFTDRSIYDDGETHLGWLGSTQAGLEFPLLEKTLRGELFGLLTLGHFQGNSLAALGAGATFGVAF